MQVLDISHYFPLALFVAFVGLLLFRMSSFGNRGVNYAGAIHVVAPLSIGVLLTVYGANSLYIEERFTGNAAHVVGIVDKLYQSHGRAGTFYDIDYHYNNGSIDVPGTYYDLPQIRWAQLHVGDKIPLKYLPSMPTISHIDFIDVDRARLLNDLYIILFGICSFCFGLYKLKIKSPMSIKP